MPSIITSNTSPTTTPGLIRARALRPPTRPERDLHGLFVSMGMQGLRREARDLPGTPDLVCDGARIAGFAHGCFWHHHPGCRLARIPAGNPGWWREKFRRNKERDARARTALVERGWQVVTLWECAGRVLDLRSQASCVLGILGMGLRHVEVGVPAATTPPHMSGGG